MNGPAKYQQNHSTVAIVRYKAKRRGRYRSIFESQVAVQLGDDWHYEAIKLPYVIRRTYIPDFVDAERKIIIETKGTLHDPAERAKLIAVRDQHSDFTFVLWFAEPDSRISGTKMTHRGWAERNGFIVI